METLIRCICYPNPALFRDSEEREEIFASNKCFFNSEIIAFAIYAFLIPLSDIHYKVHLIYCSAMFLSFLSFLAFCRSYPWAYQLIFTIFRCLIPIFLIKEPTGFTFCLQSPIFYPVLVLLKTKSLALTVMTSLVQIGYLNFLYVEALENYLWDHGPQLFTSLYVQGATAFICLNLVIVYLQYRRLILSNQALKKSRKQTESAMRKLEGFILTVSHELRNPINSLLGNLELALQEELSPKLKNMIETSKICGEIILQLISNILDSGKLEVGSLEVNLSETQTQKLFSRIWSICEELIKRKGIIGKITFARDFPQYLLLDSMRITQILLNLVGNALKFTEKGTIHIKIKWIPGKTRLDEDCFKYGINHAASSPVLGKKQDMMTAQSLADFKRRVSDQLLRDQNEMGILRMEVHDTGCGMRSEDMKGLFNKFSQVCKDNQKRQAGTGLGLFITKEICKLMKGDIKAYSKENVGSTFIVCIPTRQIPSKDKNLNFTESFNELCIKEVNALVAADSQLAMALFQQYFLKINGTITAHTTKYSEVFKKFVAQHRAGVTTDIVILDLEETLGDIAQICEDIRNYESQHKLKKSMILVVKGEETKQACTKLLGKYGPDAVLGKPLAFSEFVDIILQGYK